MFDTYIAAKTLGFPRGCLSLAFLLQHYCNEKTDKKFQLADWRIRPLTEEMLRYARSDTRHLIKIHHLMKNALIEQGNENNNLLISVYDQSNDLCKQRYEKPLIHSDGYLTQLRKSNINFNSRQLHAYKELFDWRNKIARDEDESEMYVLPPHMLLKISSELPREMQGIIACCNPVPPHVKQNLHYLHQIVFKAREQPLTSVPNINSSNSLITDTSINCSLPSTLDVLENPLKCPLDLSSIQRHQEQEDVLDVLLRGTDIDVDKLDTNQMALSVPYKVKPTLDIFSSNKKQWPKNHGIEHVNIFLSPFQRLQLLKPYLDAMSIKQEGVKVENKKADRERIQSIKAHFDALTAMTPEEYNSEKRLISEDNCDNTDPEHSENDVSNMLDAYDPDPGKVQALRSGLKDGRKKFKKQRASQLQSEENTINKASIIKTNTKIPVDIKSEGQAPKRNSASFENVVESKRNKSDVNRTQPTIDFENADFSQYSCGVKTEKKSQLNHWNELNKKGKMNQKGKTGFKRASKTSHLKKS